MDALACRGLQSAMAGLGGTGPPVTVRLEVIGDYSRDELAAAEAAHQAPSEPCQHRQSAADGSLPARGSQGALHIASGAHRALPGSDTDNRFYTAWTMNLHSMSHGI